MIEFTDETIQKEYDFLKMEEEDLSESLERIRDKIRDIEDSAERH
jgi:hypothetical protein